MTLPIAAVLPDLLAALDAGPNAVLVAPPGAGKTTAVAPALLDRPWCTGEVLLLSPRRLAARAAAERIAECTGTRPGGLIGYATRLDSARSAATRLLVATHGVFLARIQADPELAGVSAILFDEVHERSLDADLGLALALDAQGALRPDLRLLAMSATLDGARVSALLGDAPIVESAGRAYPIEIRHLGRPDGRIEDGMAAAIRRAAAQNDGDLLAFLPGIAEIERTAERLEGALPPASDLHRLHGSLDPAAQRAAIRAAPPGRRKIVLASAIAETSITVDGLRIVVDSGLARRPRYDRGAGITRLVTERASQAAVTQRAGRAGRQAPGVVYRLWEAAATAALPRHDPPEIVEADLSALVLSTAIWGVADPRSLRWIDPPPDAGIAEARRRLESLGALGADGRPTAHGRRIAAMPLPPRLAHMLIAAAGIGLGDTAADVAALLSENGLGGRDADLDARRRRWRGERGRRADAARAMARGWARLAGRRAHGPTASDDQSVGACVALAFPDRLARRRDGSGEEWISVGGRGFRLDAASPLARGTWLAVAEVSGAAAGARILSAAAIDEATVEALYGDRIESGTHLRFEAEVGAVRATRVRRLGAIRLSETQDAAADPEAVAAALLDGVRAHGLDLLPWGKGTAALRRRAAFARTIDPALPDLCDAALLAQADQWLAPVLAGRRRLGDIEPGALAAAIDMMLGWGGRQAVDRIAPADFTSPAGSTHPIDYEADAGPTVALRVQALFGLAEHPAVAGIPLVLSLTSPAGRPIQTTRDLPGFWRGSWADVAREMRGRYPRHPWPDDPAAAAPTLRTKKALQSRGR